MNYEVLKEIIESIRQHKARSILTGFGIAWGMFILIVLLGAGNGFKTGILQMFGGYASNSIWVTGQWVSKAEIGGMQDGSRIRFDDDILRKLKKRFPQISSISSEVALENSNIIEYKGNTNTFEVKGIDENYRNIKILEIGDGRFLNEKDYREQRRSVVIGSRVNEMMFGNESAVGKQIGISGAYFQVVGVLGEGTLFGMMEQNSMYVPDVTLYNTFNPDKKFLTFGALLHEKTSVETFETQLRKFLAEEIGFSKDDRKALYVNNVQLQVKAFNSLFKGINGFLWVLGICFLLSGMIGVTNIMLVVVKERTEEIAIRKAIGATPDSILFLIIMEALIITLLFGLVGLLLGYAGMAVYNWVVLALQTGQEAVFSKASVEWYIVLSSFLILIVSGVVAGLFPAQKAAKIMPVEAFNKVV
jgi:putative ABC transport system permease protein